MNNELNREINLKSILAFTLPSIFMMVVMSLYTIVDGIFVSRLINTNAFSAVNIIYPLMSIVIGLGTMFGTGTTAIVSRKLGEGRQKEANQIVTFIILFTIGLGIAFSVVSCLFLGDIIHLLGANDAVFDYCREYALPIILFLPFSLLQVQFQSLFVANGKPGTGLLVTLVSGLANVFLDYYFIAVCNMGVAGAAVATGIGYFIAAVFGLYYFARHREAPLHFVKPRASMQTLMRAMTNGSSEMVSNLSTSVTTFLFNIIMMRLNGPDGVAAISILLYLDFVLIAINLGYSIGVAPLFSYNYGSGDCRKLKKLFRISLYFCTSVGVVMTAGTVLFATGWLPYSHRPAAPYTHLRLPDSEYLPSATCSKASVFLHRLCSRHSATEPCRPSCPLCELLYCWYRRSCSSPPSLGLRASGRPLRLRKPLHFCWPLSWHGNTERFTGICKSFILVLPAAKEDHYE
ncbi:Staphylococcal virulence regulator protein A [uncultured Clostridium sp.]|nr:Staphylococcal virulence regulator protein A [uncultured Clostridium sp.]